MIDERHGGRSSSATADNISDGYFFFLVLVTGSSSVFQVSRVRFSTWVFRVWVRFGSTTSQREVSVQTLGWVRIMFRFRFLGSDLFWCGSTRFESVKSSQLSQRLGSTTVK
ncbi:hypothetical protein HanRHA438_Chr11g0499491 [Helianthus annuus]|uniref:Uncharacterized protein n=1 Tax=Helianthus annuus TaxID=4232 RepID=A0A251TB07_HELAN|nr:hypothetical protein HanHA300_Chr11g0398991 [Helianthus annuus]KAJ0509029.1 hypothetical protein HanIR_Chr11g0524041 [Helianthus annuus]KAJ0517177.1 hypothetical protein HanHA89_Chr11g0422301 [Helianthus annuus]KAJ0685186.1 hypothetical protein HanLR1_Chr11g0399731 [Helianthus annuus]KAJ0689097.1 hypothetical protein HanOQP8_Chr11g0401761 [Helianthus annuus]